MKKLRSAVLPHDGFGQDVTIKMISFLATGNEIIQGDVQDTNSNFFAKSISTEGGTMYQHMQVSDKKQEITSALRYLLRKSDAVVICGGLGPTSDDVTRFAVADVTKEALQFTEDAWSHIVKRLKRFNLPVSESNRQQALFPKMAELYPNENGTAFGCHIEWQNKHIFMLPGPPNECRPLFSQYVIPTLKKYNFFLKKKMYRWLTLGLIEGEIATTIDSIAKPYLAKTAYRANYPYLEIKLMPEEKEDAGELMAAVETVLFPFVVSRNEKNAFETLEEILQSFKKTIYIIDEATQGQFAKQVDYKNIICIEKDHSKKLDGILFCVRSSRALQNQTDFFGSITLECTGYVDDQQQYTYTLSIPNRGPEVMEYVKHYIAWQLQQFIKNL